MPGFQLVIRRFDVVVGNDIVDVLNLDMFSDRKNDMTGGSLSNTYSCDEEKKLCRTRDIMDILSCPVDV